MIESSWLGTVIASLVSAALTLVGARHFFARLAEKAVQHGLDRRLESWKAELRSDEERLKAALRSADEQVAALRSGALSGMAGRQAALMNRQLQAIERIWSEVMGLQRFNLAAMMAPVMAKLVAGRELTAAETESYKKLATQILDNLGAETDLLKIVPPDGALNDRLFIDPMSWSLYCAYRLMIVSSVFQLVMIKSGDGNVLGRLPNFFTSLKEVLPEHADDIDGGNMFAVISPLQEKLFDQLKETMIGKQNDSDAVRRAADILADVKAAEGRMVPKTMPEPQ